MILVNPSLQQLDQFISKRKDTLLRNSFTEFRSGEFTNCFKYFYSVMIPVNPSFQQLDKFVVIVERKDTLSD